VVEKNCWYRKFEEIAVGSRNSLWAVELMMMIMMMVMMVDNSKAPTSCLCVRISAYFHQYNGVQPYDINDNFGRFIFV
jgi:hypothetical protein